MIAANTFRCSQQNSKTCSKVSKIVTWLSETHSRTHTQKKPPFIQSLKEQSLSQRQNQSHSLKIKSQSQIGTESYICFRICKHDPKHTHSHIHNLTKQGTVAGKTAYELLIHNVPSNTMVIHS